MSNDRNLILGILALQNDFITRDQLVEAMNAWVLAKQRSLGDLLRERGALGQPEFELLEALVTRQLQRHGGDVEKSLQALSWGTFLRSALAVVDDADVQASLRHLQTPPPPEATTAQAPDRGADGMRYRILRSHAKGGLGEVYVAQDVELNREVALKQIQDRHAEDAGSRGRFLLEAEITGRLEHPGIVPVYGLGAYADGRPFYAMRFIKGDNLKHAIDEFHQSGGSFDALAFRRLLGRFLDVCNAIAYAHSRGVLHRDLKPGNVMLGEFGETLVVDWGLAKVVGRSEEDEGEATLTPSSGSSYVATIAGMAVGTPAFMSPEQAEGKLDQLGPATDVYSLGATLYSLLTGKSPVHGTDAAEVLEKVRRGDIPPARQIKADVPRALSAICQKAMAWKGADRYPTVQALATDVEHWLADEPVSCLVEPLSVRARRFARRHRTLVTSAAAALVVATVSLSTALGIVSSLNQRLDAANGALGEKNRALEKATASERTERERAEKTLDFFVAALRRPDPAQDGKKLTVYELLARSAKDIDADATLDPGARCALLDAIGRTYDGLGEYPQAIIACEAACRLAAEHFGDVQSKTLSYRSTLGVAYEHAGKQDLSIPLLERTLNTQESALGADHPDTLATRNNLAMAHKAVGKLDHAIAHLERTLRIREATLGNEHHDVLVSRNNLATAYEDAGKLELAIPLYERTLKLREATLGEEHLDTLISRNNLAGGYLADGKPAQAIPLFERTLRIREAKVGEDHPETLTTRSNLATAYVNAGKPALAIPLLVRTLQTREATLGHDHPDTLTSCNNLAGAYQAAGQMDLAIPLYERTLKDREAKLGNDHPDTLSTRNNLGMAYLATGKVDLAISFLDRALKAREEKLGSDHPKALSARNNLAMAYHTAKKLDLAIPLYERTLKAQETKLGSDHPDTLSTRNNLALAYKASGRLDRAIPLYEQTLRARGTKLGDDHPNTLVTRHNLASAYVAANRLDLAIPIYERTLKAREDTLGRDHPQTLLTRGDLARAYLDANDAARSLPLFDGYVEGYRRRTPFDEQQFAGLLSTVATLLLRARQSAAAEKYLREAYAIRDAKEAGTWTTFQTRLLLGESLLGQNKDAEAEPLLVGAYDGMKRSEAQITPLGKALLTESLLRIVDLYAASGKSAEASKWESRLPPEVQVKNAAEKHYSWPLLWGWPRF